ncbi:MAG: heavy-metal-associated domain-containing protein [Phaeodactylibacter sp.]|nr:heavy-metal-associated domain-containing protein [Phaeodactylibacter sp.]MCB9272591.1 heavy-metal-associated domain-containing protein [Lewinellaceae bacterium]
MKKLLFMFALALAGAVAANAQSTPACCAGKDKSACTKEAAAKAACCASKDKASCTKMAAADTGAMPAAADNIVEATFTVYGNCGMCKRTIEGALADVSAVSSANWDMKNKQLTVRYDAQAIQLKDIKAKVAAAGYDSDTHRAPDAAYNNLHACCQYERPKS